MAKKKTTTKKPKGLSKEQSQEIGKLLRKRGRSIPESAHEKQRRIMEIVNLRMQKVSPAEIKDIMQAKYAPLSERRLHQEIREANAKIKDFLENDVRHVRIVHAERYEWFYHWFLDQGYDGLAMQALGYIEKLLGLGSNVVALSIQSMIEKKKEPNLYNYSNLTKKELSRLTTLFNKAKR